MLAVMRTLQQVGYEFMVMPDHVPGTPTTRGGARPSRSPTAISRRCCRRYDGRRIGASSSHGAERAWPLQRRSPRGDRARHAGVGAALHRDERRRRRELTDRTSDTVVSILPSVGNIAYRMTVKGQDVLRYPHASIDDFKAQPEADRHSVHGAVGQPARRAGVLRQRQALRLRHGAGQRARRHPDSRLPHHDRPVAGRGGQGRRGRRLGDEPAGVLQAAGVDEAVAVRAHDRDHLSPAGRRARGRDRR